MACAGDARGGAEGGVNGGAGDDGDGDSGARVLLGLSSLGSFQEEEKEDVDMALFFLSLILSNSSRLVIIAQEFLAE